MAGGGGEERDAYVIASVKSGVGCLPNSRTSPVLVFLHSRPLEALQVTLLFHLISSSALFMSLGKDARLFVFRLSALQKGLEGKQTGKSRSDCRENKLEKTKGDLIDW